MDVRALVEASELDGLVRAVDGLAVAGDWDGIVELRELCREAVSRGKQVWGPAEYAAYRLALDAPAPYAAAALEEGARHAPGPLWEVAASTHRFEELAPHVATARLRTLVAHERALRGESVPVGDGGVLGVPVGRRPWEPAYTVAVYRADGVDHPSPERGDGEEVALPAPGRRLPDDAVVDALLGLVRPWWEESSGKAEAAAVSGDAFAAIRAVGPTRVRIVEVSFASALAAMAWAASSGGAFGRRRGTPVGRAEAWWAVALLLGHDEPPRNGDLLAEGEELHWFLWDPGDRVGGWSLHLAVEDSADGIAWALTAVDMP